MPRTTSSSELDAPRGRSRAWSRRPAAPRVGEVRRPRRPLPEFKRDRLYRRVRPPRHDRGGARSGASGAQRELRGGRTCQRLARAPRTSPMKVVDVEMRPGAAGASPCRSAPRSASTSASSCATSPASSGPGSRCGRSAPATPPAHGRHRPVRPAALLLLATSEVRAHLGEDGQGPGHAAHRQPAPRQLRAAQVLPSLRVLDLRGAAAPAARAWARPARPTAGAGGA